MIRICCISLVAAEIGKPYLALMQGILPRIAGKDTQVDLMFAAPGLARLHDSRISYFAVLNTRDVVEAVIKAENQGYDAAVLGIFIDRGLREARSVVKIPVIGGGEASMLLACMLGYKFGVVTLNSTNVIPECETLIRLYGLEDRAIVNPIRRVSASIYEVMGPGMTNPEVIAADIIDKAKVCVQDGADVIIAACGALGPQCTAAGVNRIPDTEIPILDPVSVAIKTAEMMVDLKEKLGIPVPSRASLYGLPGEKHLERIRQIVLPPKVSK